MTRGRVWAWMALAGAVAGTTGGCGEADLPGHYWNLVLSTEADGCNATPVTYSEELEYRVEFGIETVDVAVGADVFATGVSNGCQIEYESVVWTETREAGDIQWSLAGEATAQRGDGACGIPSDWVGTETFTVISSADPAVQPGCTYTLALNGNHLREVQ